MWNLVVYVYGENFWEYTILLAANINIKRSHAFRPKHVNLKLDRSKMKI